MWETPILALDHFLLLLNFYLHVVLAYWSSERSANQIPWSIKNFTSQFLYKPPNLHWPLLPPWPLHCSEFEDLRLLIFKICEPPRPPMHTEDYFLLCADVDLHIKQFVLKFHFVKKSDLELRNSLVRFLLCYESKTL